MPAIKYAPNGDLTTANKSVSNTLRGQLNAARTTVLNGAPDEAGVVLGRVQQQAVDALAEAVAKFDQHLRESQV